MAEGIKLKKAFKQWANKNKIREHLNLELELLCIRRGIGNSKIKRRN